MPALWRSIASAISSEQLGWELGWTMVYFVAAGAVLWGLAALLRRAMRPCSPHARYVASLVCLVLLAMLAPASYYLVRAYPATLMLLRPELKSAGQYGATGEAIGMDSPFRGNSWEAIARRTPGDRLAAAWSEFRSALMDERLAPILSTILPRLPWIWLIGSSLMLIYFSFGLMGADRLRRECDSLDQDDLGGLLQRLRREMGVSQRVLIGMTDRVAAPLVVGVMRPMILLPMSVVSSLSVDQLEFVLLHELAHVRRLDNLINLFQRFVEAIAFFHPAAWRISAWVRLERELCCDAAVLSRRSSPSAYAETLASLAMPGISAPYAVASLANHQLVSRVRHIMQAKEPSMRFSSRWFVATAMALLTTGGFVAAFAQTPDKPEQAKSVEKTGAGESITIEVHLGTDGVLQLQAAPDASYASVAELLKSLAGTLDKEGKHPKIKVKADAHGQKWTDWTTANCANCHQGVAEKTGDGHLGVEFKLSDACEPGVVQWLRSTATFQPTFDGQVLSTILDGQGATQRVAQVQDSTTDAFFAVEDIHRDLTARFVEVPDSWSVKQAVGAPNTFVYGDQSTAWASKSPDGQGEWLLLTYEAPVDISAVLIHETYNAGAVARVDAVLPDNDVIVLWSGEPQEVKTDSPRLFLCKPKKAVKAAKIRITVASDVVKGWNEIDAVGILDADGKVHWAKDATASSSYADQAASQGSTKLGDRLSYLNVDSQPSKLHVRRQWLGKAVPDSAASKSVQGQVTSDDATRASVLERFRGVIVDTVKPDVAASTAPVQGEAKGAIDLLLGLKADSSKEKNDSAVQLGLTLLGENVTPSHIDLVKPNSNTGVIQQVLLDDQNAHDAQKLKEIEAELELLQKQLSALREKMKAR